MKKVSVVMPVYNVEPYLQVALDSMWRQTYADFELIAVEDGSTDGSLAVLERCRDPRLRIVQHERNQGVAQTLADGIDAARGEYTVRMDGDDISLPHRLEAQVSFMDRNPEIAICGAWAKQFGAAAQLMTTELDHETIRCNLLFDSEFIHPTVIMRTRSLRENGLQYIPGTVAEDYELWRRAVEVVRTANMPEVVLRYRVRPDSVTMGPITGAKLRESLRQSDRAALRRLGIEPTERELDIHIGLRRRHDHPLDSIEAWLFKIRDTNRATGFYPRRELERIIARRWMHACHTAPGVGLAKWPRLRGSDLSGELSVTPVEAVKFSLRVRR